MVYVGTNFGSQLCEKGCCNTLPYAATRLHTTHFVAVGLWTSITRQHCSCPFGFWIVFSSFSRALPAFFHFVYQVDSSVRKVLQDAINVFEKCTRCALLHPMLRVYWGITIKLRSDLLPCSRDLCPCR